MMHWSVEYLGIPWMKKGRSQAGIDCWGCVWLVYRDVLGISLPSYDADYIDDEELVEIDGLIGAAKVSGVWQEFPLRQEREFDLAVFETRGVAAHIGIVTGKGEMLHSCRDKSTYLQRFRREWVRPLIYRHVDMLERA